MKKLLKLLLIILISVGIISLLCALANRLSAAAINDYIDTIDTVKIDNQLIPEQDELGYYFTTDEDFKILHLTDLHFVGGFIAHKNDKSAIGAVAAMVKEEKPDLIVITGDISFAVPWYGTLNNEFAHGFAKRLFEKLGVYWTVTLGNHDSENYNFYSRAAVAEMYSDETLEYCLFDKGPDTVYGECNHTITVRNTEGVITEALIMIDTNSYPENNALGITWTYDKIHDDQIKWYRDTISALTLYNESISSELSTPKSLMFMHIPIREVLYAYEEYVNNNRQNTDNTTFISGNDGESGEVIYCPEDDEQLFETILELGSTKALFYGHDHMNNFVMEYRGVTLSYGHSVDYSAYAGIAKQGYQRGCATVTCSPDGSFIIVHENYYQDKYQPPYEKESVDMSK